jgi:hypothetical protein
MTDIVERLKREIERLRAQLPAGMQDCTIQFKECQLGHGRLTATNWVDHGCQQCEIERLRAYAKKLHWALVDIRDNEWAYSADKIVEKAGAPLEPLVADWLVTQWEVEGEHLLGRIREQAAEIERLQLQLAGEREAREQNERNLQRLIREGCQEIERLRRELD